MKQEQGGPIEPRPSPPYLQLLDGVAAAADHQPHLAGRDQHLLHRGTAAVPVAVETRPVSAALHDLDQQPLGLPVHRGQRSR